MLPRSSRYFVRQMEYFVIREKGEKLTSFVHEDGAETALILSFIFFCIGTQFTGIYRAGIDGFEIRVHHKRNSLVFLPILELNVWPGNRNSNFKRGIWLTKICMSPVISLYHRLKAVWTEFRLGAVLSFLFWSSKALKEIREVFD